MKKLQIYFTAIILICVLSMSLILCACNNDGNTAPPPEEDYRDADWIKIFGCGYLKTLITLQ